MRELSSISPSSRRFFTLTPAEWVLHGLVWWFYLTMVNIDLTSSWFNASVRPGRPAPLSALLLPVYFYLHGLWLIPRFLRKRRMGRYLLYTTLLLLIPEFIRAALYTKFLTTNTAGWAAFRQNLWGRDSLLFATLSPALPGLILSFAWRFSRDWWVYGRHLEQLETQRLRQELRQLKAQVDPHFLFNNLNTLDELIEQDATTAQNYLRTLARIYRYLLQTADSDVVPLTQEWAFLQDYLYLLRIRYGDAYIFRHEVDAHEMPHWLIPPATLQQLVANVVKHNVGNPQHPLITTIRMANNSLECSNPIRPKNTTSPSLGIGLDNIKQRFRLLAAQPVRITSNDVFTVHLPRIEITS